MKKFSLLFLLILVSLIPLLAFLHPGLPLTHDGQDHVARIGNFYQSLKEGNLVPRWAANLNWGYGHPILMFLYPLPSYIASLFHFLGLGLVDSVKVVFALSFILSGIFMFLWVKEIWGKEAGFAAGIIYLFAPYRFVDLYVRGAIGECWAFVWPPLICYFVLKLQKTGNIRFLTLGAISLALLVLSHNALTLMFLPIIFGYMPYLLSQSRRKSLFVIRYSLFTALGFSLSSFFWLPAFIEGKYTLRDIVTAGNITGFERFSRLIWSGWNYGGSGSFSVQLGLVGWLVIVVSPFLLWQLAKRKEKIWLFLVFLFVYFWIAVFMMLPVSQPIYFWIPLLQKFQFAWRFLSVSIFIPAIFGGALVYIISNKLKKPFIIGLVLISLILNRDYFKALSYLSKPESFYTGVYAGTTDTGESAPRWSVRFMEIFPKAHLEVIDGQATINEGKRLTNLHLYRVEAQVPTRLAENTLYFPGWDVRVDGKIVPIEFQNPKFRGLITFSIPPGEHQLKLEFTQTKLRLFADLVSLGSVVALVLLASILKVSRLTKRKLRFMI